MLLHAAAQTTEGLSRHNAGQKGPQILEESLSNVVVRFGRLGPSGFPLAPAAVNLSANVTKDASGLEALVNKLKPQVSLPSFSHVSFSLH
jgi:hypothetical protein